VNYHIDASLRQPQYIQLYRLLVKDITEGVYPTGSRLPSKRVIAGETGVSVITVEHALELLCDEGYAEARQRSGLYVIYRGEDFQVTGAPVSEGAKPPREKPAAYGGIPFTALAKTMRKVLLDAGESILVKSPNHGCLELRNEISAYLARSRGISVDASRIIIGSGAEYLYGLIAQLLGTDRVYALETPSYEKIHKVYATLGVKCDMLEMGENGIPTALLAKTPATVLHVTPFNSFPTGVTADASKKREYLRWARERNGFIIEDNYDSELTVSAKPEDSLFSMAGGENVIYINTFSRTVAPSMRAGYMLLPEALVEDFGNRLGFYSCTVPLFEQFVLAELIRSGDFERHINKARRLRRRAEEDKNEKKRP